jgi:hypothetical protein
MCLSCACFAADKALGVGMTVGEWSTVLSGFGRRLSSISRRLSSASRRHHCGMTTWRGGHPMNHTRSSPIWLSEALQVVGLTHLGQKYRKW